MSSARIRGHLGERGREKGVLVSFGKG